MSDTKHTPGPWVMLDRRKDGVISTRSGGLIARVKLGGRYEDAVAREMNASLIATAPELLAAAEQLIRYVPLPDSPYRTALVEACDRAQTQLPITTCPECDYVNGHHAIACPSKGGA